MTKLLDPARLYIKLNRSLYTGVYTPFDANLAGPQKIIWWPDSTISLKLHLSD